MTLHPRAYVLPMPGAKPKKQPGVGTVPGGIPMPAQASPLAPAKPATRPMVPGLPRRVLGGY